MKNLLIKLGLWEENTEQEVQKVVDEVRQEIHEEFIREAYRHYCSICKRWFGDVRGKLMHNRHKHKNA